MGQRIHLNTVVPPITVSDDDNSDAFSHIQKSEPNDPDVLCRFVNDQNAVVSVENPGLQRLLNLQKAFGMGNVVLGNPAAVAKNGQVIAYGQPVQSMPQMPSDNTPTDDRKVISFNEGPATVKTYDSDGDYAGYWHKEYADAHSRLSNQARSKAAEQMMLARNMEASGDKKGAKKAQELAAHCMDRSKAHAKAEVHHLEKYAKKRSKELNESAERILEKSLQEASESAQEIEKAGGEGTRGGKIIGHTASGKPIYENHKFVGLSGAVSKLGTAKNDYESYAKQKTKAHGVYVDALNNGSAGINEKLAGEHGKKAKDAAFKHKLFAKEQADAKNEGRHGDAAEHQSVAEWNKNAKEYHEAMHELHKQAAKKGVSKGAAIEPPIIKASNLSPGPGKVLAELEEPVIIKAGPGSRGGKVIGYDKTGKPMYERTHPHVAEFQHINDSVEKLKNSKTTVAEHTKLAGEHKKRANDFAETWKRGKGAHTEIVVNQHLAMAREHTNAAKKKTGK